MSAANGPSPHEPLNVRVLTMSLDPSPALAALAIDNDGHLVGALRCIAMRLNEHMYMSRTQVIS